MFWHIATWLLILAISIYDTYCFIRILDRIDQLEEELSKLRDNP